MSDAILQFLKFCLLAVLYLFLARVVWIVARELRGTPERVVPEAQTTKAPPPERGRGKSKSKKGWRLVVVEPASEAGAAYPVEGEITLGRGGGCTVPLAFDTFVSQVHARAFERDGTLWIEDLGSRNGTFVNDQQVQEPTRVGKGTRLRVGQTVLEVER